MMRKLFYIIVSVLLITACKDSQPTPDGILAQDKMAMVLADFHIAEASMSLENIQEDSLKKTMNSYYEEIYMIHHISKKQFDDSFHYYEKHPELLDKIYQQVISELSKKQGEAAN
jgi:hypothetical protein